MDGKRTRKELLKFKIATDDQCTLCSNHDSVIHTFKECAVTTSIYSSALNWFNYTNNVSFNSSIEQILFHLKDVKSNLTTAQERRLDFLLLCTKQYIYACKIALKTPNTTELKRKIETQWKIENVFQLIKLVCLRTLLLCFSYI